MVNTLKKNRFVCEVKNKLNYKVDYYLKSVFFFDNVPKSYEAMLQIKECFCHSVKLYVYVQTWLISSFEHSRLYRYMACYLRISKSMRQITNQM